jgi:hypothetical protein
MNPVPEAPAYPRSGGWPHPLVERTLNVAVHKGTYIYNCRRPPMRQATLPLSELAELDLTRGFVVPILACEV